MKININVMLVVAAVLIFSEDCFGLYDIKNASNIFRIYNCTPLKLSVQAGASMGGSSAWVDVNPFTTVDVMTELFGILNKVDIRTVINGNTGSDGHGICIYYEKFAATGENHVYTLIYGVDDKSLTANINAGTYNSPKVSVPSCAKGRLFIFSGSGDPIDGTMHPSTFSRDYIKR